jgi:peptide/nickel transport system permease protein
MFGYIARRMVATIPVAATVGLVVFLLLHLSPGDPAAVIAGDGAGIEEVARIRTELGLDQPLHEQFGRWAVRVIQGDLGASIFSKVPVTELIGQRIGPTLSLSFVTLVLSVTAGIALGLFAAATAGSFLDHALILVAIAGFSVPIFVIGYVLVLVFAIDLDWLPVQGYVPLADGFWQFLRHLILPSVALSLAYLALISRITRASVLEILAQDYVRTAYAKGFGDARVFTGHVLRNAAVPITTIVGIGVALLISGVVVTESVFNIPGIGRLVVDAISRRDYPVIQGVTLVFAGVYVLINLLVDLACGLFDPRIRV